LSPSVELRFAVLFGTSTLRLLELENDAVSSVYEMAGDDKERVVYDVGIYALSGLSEHSMMTKGEMPNFM
jgi:hypothetical protein